MNKINEKELNNSSLIGESMLDLKSNLQPELNKVKSKHILKNYSQVFDSHENENKLILETRMKKPRNQASRDYNSKTILEYSFVQDYKDQNEENKTCTDIPIDQSMKKSMSFYDRNIEEKIVVNQRLEEIRNKKRLYELSLMKSSPGMNENSKKIVNQKSAKERPLFLRYQDEMEFKKMKLENLKNIVKGDEEMNPPQRSRSFNQSEFTGWVDSNQAWNQNKIAKLEYLKKDIEERENCDEELYFNPKIDKASQMMAFYKNKKENPNVTFYDKLYRKHGEKLKKIESKKAAMIPTFMPKVNKCPSYIRYKVNNYSLSQTFFFEADEEKSKKSTTVSTTSPNMNILKIPKTIEEAKPKLYAQDKPLLLKSKSTNNIIKNLEKKQIYDNTDNLYKLNLRNSSAWRKQVNNVKPDTKANEILKLSVKYWQ